ncbi:hypothetical protein GX51_06455 [Blastomyces parvus]|uniref:Uncharacterized protein n=1 Tax=Blastomyces parvus TaxID=2060905 RepID=A0A2B7WR36_9EURO|nr:hypothetical protein GX51_06455 [Blastomyces parvus]
MADQSTENDSPQSHNITADLPSAQRKRRAPYISFGDVGTTASAGTFGSLLRVQVRTNPLFHYSLKLSPDAALAIVTPELDHTIARLMEIGSGVFREGGLNSTLHRPRQYHDFLKQALHDLVSLSKEHIHQVETNLKTHMFLDIVLAQAEAVEVSVPVELQVAQDTRDNLKLQ